MRYFLELAYLGTAYAGWQRQDNALTVQQVVEEGMETVLRQPIEVTGCGRTDAGVHAMQFFCHTDLDREIRPMQIGRINMVLPPDIVIREVVPVHGDAHARFDAVSRRYRYRITLCKDPFSLGRSYHFSRRKELDLDLLHKSAGILLQYSEFSPFCKSKSDAMTKKCKLTESVWTVDGDSLVYAVTADRFLRGMVRLIVGMCLNVALGKLALEEVKNSMDLQIPIPGSWSVPAEGLYLTRIRYPFMQP